MSCMRTVLMCFSILQVPRCRTHTLANFWWESSRSLYRTCGRSCSFRLLGSKANGMEGGYSKRWIRRPVSTKTGGESQTTRKSKSTTIGHEILDETVSTRSTLNIKKTEDLQGGENSTFQTLVNPGRHVTNSDIHHITTHMVCRPDVPRMEELIPILLQYVKSRQKPGGYVLFVAHNARSFDVPFLVNEFGRHHFKIPQNWLFVDTRPLAREVLKMEGLKVTSGTSLEALCKKYNIQFVGKAHRAMADVTALSLVLQRLTFDLKLPLSGLIAKHFTPSELTSAKKKK
ncbi:exonuclease DPD1, chloroplastic/mitochondrial isoform X2 [Populus alba]|uniref:exonuclease DPD1, chloroplastic/mitochondrial isoform X2 n=1 Tax=Populus alba TaxID=43335 RepID=UPI0015896000|nr:exonuclease DPD1, chloroplastic/mitochondrial isoform X2 [Populus alba]